MDDVKPGQVVICKFPYSDESGDKMRPVLVVSSQGGENFIGCMVTRVQFPDSIALTSRDFTSGRLRVEPCFLIPLRISSVSKGNILKIAGIVQHSILKQTITAITSSLGK